MRQPPRSTLVPYCALCRSSILKFRAIVLIILLTPSEQLSPSAPPPISHYKGDFLGKLSARLLLRLLVGEKLPDLRVLLVLPGFLLAVTGCMSFSIAGSFLGVLWLFLAAFCFSTVRLRDRERDWLLLGVSNWRK